MQRVDEGISEDEAWRLFQQIVDALAHMSTLNILHRDIKLTNIFIGVFRAMTLLLTHTSNHTFRCEGRLQSG
jgi:hypothetical protein